MGNTIIKFYGDGEFRVDGQKKARIYSDGEIWADGKKIGRLYEDGDIWIDGKKVGSCTENGEIWIHGKKVATGVHLLSVFEKKNTASSSSCESSYSGGGNSTLNQVGDVVSSALNGSLFLGSFVVLVICTILASFLVWTRGIPDIFATNFNSQGVQTIALVCTYAGMLFMMYKHWDVATREGEPMFFVGLLLQGLACLVNILVFYLLDIFITAFSYGLSLLDVFSHFGTFFTGFLGAAIGVILFFGLAPAIVSTIFNFLYLHFKGRRYKTTKKKDSPPKKKSTSSKTASSQPKQAATPSKPSTEQPASATNQNTHTTKTHLCFCGCKLRFPIDQGEYHFTCPKCGKSYTFQPPK